MPAYSLQQDPPRLAARVSTVPTVSSVYSDDDINAAPEPPNIGDPHKDSYHPAYHAHPRQQINDYGPQVRQSRLPIFKQVRSMLHKPATVTRPANPKWDEYTGELSDTGKASKVKPSAYVSPWEGAFKANRKRSPERPHKLHKDKSQVSVLRDDEVSSAQAADTGRHYYPRDISPVSPPSPVSPLLDAELAEDEGMVPEWLPEPLSPNVQRAPPLEQTPESRQVKRKPVSRDASAAENHPPVPPQHSPSQSGETGERMIGNKDLDDRDGGTQPNSHFSWTTYAPSVAPERPSIDTVATRQSKYPSGYPSGQEPMKSHFSWSTVNTAMTNRFRPDSPPASPPPPVPEKFRPEKPSAPPVQSILSRQRPIRRFEQEEWAPPPRKSSTPQSATPKDSSTPTSATTARPLPLPKDRTPTSKAASPSSASGKNSASKALPLPPGLANSPNLTHLEALLAQERSIIIQRKNVEKGIYELEKIEKASPLDVPFATVRDAKKRLAQYRTRLAEVKLEERDIGIAIARTRRKEEKDNFGDGESLWVRRVTG